MFWSNPEVISVLLHLDESRRLRKRVGYICEVCEVQPIFFTRKDYAAHVKNDRASA